MAPYTWMIENSGAKRDNSGVSKRLSKGEAGIMVTNVMPYPIVSLELAPGGYLPISLQTSQQCKYLMRTIVY